MSDRVQRYFDVSADAFDAIYTGRKGRAAALLDRVFRRDMRARFEKALRECGDVRGAAILDVGCGSGHYALELARRGARVTGVDVAGTVLQIARRKACEQGVDGRCNFVAGDFLSLPLEPTFAVTLAIGFFDYTSAPLPYLRKMRMVTGGKLIATFPRLWTWRAPIRKIRLAFRGCPVYFYTKRRVARLLHESGWGEARIERCGKLHFVVASARDSGGQRCECT